MAMAVEATTLTAKPVERTTEYIATVKSRRSTTIQPQVEGFITRITARPGQRVSRGTVLMEIDSESAAGHGRQPRVGARGARQPICNGRGSRPSARRSCYDAGAVSQQEYEQAATAVQTTEAQLQGRRGADSRAARRAGLSPRHRADRRHRRRHSGARRRSRDRDRPMLTTVDENAGLELYINVPVAQAPALKPGMPVRIVDDAGKPVATTAVNFISPSVDTGDAVRAGEGAARQQRAVPDRSVRRERIWCGATSPA